MMTATEAREFLIACSKNWDQPQERIEKFLAWQRHASKTELLEIESWHKNFLATCPYPISTDDQMTKRNERFILDAIAAEQKSNPYKPEQRKNRYLFLKIAATVIIVLGLTWALWQQRDTASNHTITGIGESEQAYLRPGSDKAVLLLADGRKIILDSTNAATELKGTDLDIQQTGIGIIAITAIGDINAQGSGENILTTPVGGTYQIILPDGSHIWLNSNSSLHFPSKFASGKREVSFTGEGYFEIKHNAEAPFTVKVRNMAVKVLGTGFNIMAYENEASIKTTLFHGSINVNNGINEQLIQPGEQVALKNGETKFAITKPKLDQEIAWRQGQFWFNRTPIQEIMRQIERWYHVKVIYDGDLSGINITGKLSKKQNAADLLGVLEATKEVKFKVNQDTITVSPFSEEGH